MGQVTLLGASGFTGRLVAAALDRRALPFLAAGRDADAVARAVAAHRSVVAVEVADVARPESLEHVCRDATVLLTTVGPFARLGRPVLDAAVAAGCHYVDSTGEQSFMRWAFDERGADAARAGICALPAFGFDYVPGDLLAAVAAAQVEAPREVHVAYLVRGRGVLASRGTRTTLATLASEPMLAWDGSLRDERVGEARRLAWFPRPVGPRHAAAIPGGEALTVPRHVRGVEVVRTYMAMPSIAAEGLQFGAALARWAPADRLLRRAGALGPEGPSPRQRAATRWACVAEVAGADGTVVRAWANGRDVYGFTAEAMALAAARLLDDGARASGVVAPAEAFAAESVLDELADVAGLRWSITPAAARR
ncbi:MAG: saccharopine dehydrogenase NADP-binding domain-containing protein [Actinobacteria bacterium]|nr:saccharopine dehydrogenase NADP-binding domain-containing protein [Actinomycetota bacterium]